MDHETVPAANNAATVANGGSRARCRARVGINGQPQRDFIHSLAYGNADSFVAPEGEPVAHERFLMFPGELKLGRAMARIPIGNAQILSQRLSFRPPGNRFHESHGHGYRCRDAGRCDDAVIRDVASIFYPLHGRMRLA